MEEARKKEIDQIFLERNQEIIAKELEDENKEA